MKLLAIGLLALFTLFQYTLALVMNVEIRDGYQIVEHVKNFNGNLRKIYNIPNAKRTPVILQYRIPLVVDGLSAKNNLPYLLYDADFDVWMIEWNKSDFEVTEQNQKSNLEILINHIEDYNLINYIENNTSKKTFACLNDVQVLDELFKGQDVLNSAIINPEGKVIFVVFGDFIDLERLQNDRNLVSKIKVFVNLKEVEPRNALVSSLFKNKTLIQSEIFEQKLSQVVSDSVCPSSQLYGEQCKMVVLTLINPGTLVKIINEVSGLLKNVNVEPKVYSGSSIREILGTKEASNLIQNTDKIIEFLRSGRQTIESNELLTLLEILSKKLNTV